VSPSQTAGYWPSAWPGEDGGPSRRQAPAGARPLGIKAGERLEATARDVFAATMLIHRDPGEVFLLRHTMGPDAVAQVERIDPVTLEPLEISPDLPGGPMWPGGIAAHSNGSLYVVFGRHAHRLDVDCTPIRTVELPRERPYNSFVILPDGCIATKDFAKDGSLPSELLVLEPEHLGIVGRQPLPERSIARLSADGSTIYVVGDASLLRAEWRDGRLELDDGFGPRYRTQPGQTYGWDAVLDAGSAWFLDNGEGSERYAGSHRGQGISEAPLHLIRVDLGSGQVTTAEICGLPRGLVANPPAIDPERRIAVGFDASNGVLAAFRFSDDAELSPLWSRQQSHAGHMLRYPATGELVTGDHDAERGVEQVVVLDIETGDERTRTDTGSPVQSVLFPAPGLARDLYWVTFTTVTRLAVVDR
jgi:hypothetical protein